MINPAENRQTADENSPLMTMAAHTLADSQAAAPPTYTVVLDNLDFFVAVRNQSIYSSNKSIHWTHHIAVQDRIPFLHISNEKPDVDIECYDLCESLPGLDTQAYVRREFVVLGSRVMCKHLSAFSTFSDVVVHHIPHEYSMELAQRSNVPIGTFVQGGDKN